MKSKINVRSKNFKVLFVFVAISLLPLLVGATPQATSLSFAGSSGADFVCDSGSLSEKPTELPIAEFFPELATPNENLADLSIRLKLNRHLPLLDEDSFRVTGAVLKEVKRIGPDEYNLRLFCSGCGCPAISLNIEKIVDKSIPKSQMPEYVHYIPGADGSDVIIDGSHFVLVPATKLPDGELVAPFYCAKFVTGRRNAASAQEEKAVSEPTTAPWVGISAYDASAVAESAGFRLISEKQWLAIAHNAISVAENWNDNRIGSSVADGGGFFRGLANDCVDGPVPAYFANRPYNPGAFGLDNRVKKLTNGAEIWDIGGNVWQWVELTQSDRNNLAAIDLRGWIDPSSSSISTGSMKVAFGSECGVGKIFISAGAVPEFAARGGTWSSQDLAGAFSMNLNGDARIGYPMVGFRMAKLPMPPETANDSQAIDSALRND